MLMPNNIPAPINSKKLLCANATAAMTTAIAADNEAIANPRARPIRRINIVAGIVVIATATIINDTGKVANALFTVNEEPIIPPRVTITIEPVAEINWQKTRMTRLRVFIRKTAAGQVPHSHTFEVRLTAFF
jgi:hypothetical protein